MVRRKQAALIVLLLIGGYALLRTASPKGFSLKQVSSSLEPRSAWMTPSPTAEERERVQLIFSAPLRFLGEGAQAYAFESADQKYVVKFFKMRRFTPSFADTLCPHVVRRRLRNLHWVFNGYKMAYDHFREDTGLVFLHLAKTADLHQAATLIDALGKQHTVDLDKTEFIIQEKAELIFDRLKRLYSQGCHQEADEAIANVLALVHRRITKGYADRDKAVSNNYGFVGDRPIQLDIGRLYQGTKEGQLEHIQRRIERWKSEHQSMIEYSQ